MLRIYFVFAFLIIQFTKVNAQEVNPEREFQLRDTVIVIADRYEVPLQHETNSRAYFNKTFIKNYANHSALQVLDLFLPSSFVFEKKIMGYGVGTDGGGAVQLRGLGGKPNTGVLVLINGHPDFMGIFGHPLPDVYGMSDIEGVEILSGPSSTVFGSNAMGGVINLKIKNDYSKMIDVKMYGGNFGTYDVGVKFSKKIGDTGFGLSYAKKGSDGHINQTTFQSSHFNGSIEHNFNENWSVAANLRYVPYTFDDPARISDPNNFGTYGKIERGMGDLVLLNNSENIKGSSQIYFNKGEHKFYDGFHSKDFSYGASVYQQYIVNENFHIAAGGDLIYYGGEQVSQNKNYDFTSSGIYGLALYSVNEKLNMKFGLRYQHHSLGINNISPSAGISYSPVIQLRFFANYQTGFRVPTIRDLYLFPVSNPDLQQEEVQSFETGFEYFVSYNASVKLSFYRNDVSNIILPVFNPASQPPVKYQNSGNAIQNGMESTINYFMNSHLNLQLSYSYLETGDLSAFNPKHQLKYLVGFTDRQFSLSFYGKYVDGLYAENYHKNSIPDYNLLNLSADYDFGYFNANIKIQNILNREYFVLPDYKAPGRHFLFGINFSI